jgi:hypothetical protein
MKAKLPHPHFVSLNVPSLEFCFAPFLFSFASFLVREIWKHKGSRGYNSHTQKKVTFDDV